MLGICLLVVGLVWMWTHVTPIEEDNPFHLPPYEPGERMTVTMPLSGFLAKPMEWLDDEFMPRLSNEVPVTFKWDWPQVPSQARWVP